ncbi:MAG: hypothetical protein Q9183_006817, partial [Haloplaca sp. 2 TL-2023]
EESRQSIGRSRIRSSLNKSASPNRQIRKIFLVYRQQFAKNTAELDLRIVDTGAPRSEASVQLRS